ncbi:hypothetical protein N7492_010239 [Penicillium capsulatum]|uniref:Short-chain dehydrogenase/reductase n=1 Tax=Penicillium capsulatum TaxID=69766 RepID=A0A9W9LER6_9EURO|nr:hypothetical protein N7492_010239 [Penicillium capsulatum]KAJ6112746.1 hypothetical protein N7512_008070 [Penicillium capsulatum]
MASAAHGFALVTPASRGLGFAFAQQLLAQTRLPVVATARKNCDEVRERLLSSKGIPSNAESRLCMAKVDVTGTLCDLSICFHTLIRNASDEPSISSMADIIHQEYPDTPLRLALTVPGTLHVEKSPSQIDAESALHSFQVNALGPLLLMKHLSPFLPTKSFAGFAKSEDGGGIQLPSHAIYAMMAARVGSISDNVSGGWYSYRASKASVFQLTKTFDLYLRTRSREHALAVAMHPGTVQTDFTKDFWSGRDLLQPLDSAERLLQILVNMSPGFQEGRGRCWDWKGEEVVP